MQRAVGKSEIMKVARACVSQGQRADHPLNQSKPARAQSMPRVRFKNPETGVISEGGAIYTRSSTSTPHSRPKEQTRSVGAGSPVKSEASVAPRPILRRESVQVLAVAMQSPQEGLGVQPKNKDWTRPAPTDLQVLEPGATQHRDDSLTHNPVLAHRIMSLCSDASAYNDK